MSHTKNIAELKLLSTICIPLQSTDPQQTSASSASSFTSKMNSDTTLQIMLTHSSTLEPNAPFCPQALLNTRLTSNHFSSRNVAKSKSPTAPSLMPMVQLSSQWNPHSANI
uniref:Uncharacterized protein n=1 Tax=Romanomermis culicivorax TaxID=13658 RepID=A0A915HMT5_ROMCU